MKCKCNGNLKRIAVDCYQCERCGMKQAIAFAAIPLRVNNKLNIDTGICVTNSIDVQNFTKAITEALCEALMVRRAYLHNK